MKSKIVTTIHKDDELKQPSTTSCLECVIDAESYYKRNRRFYAATYVRLWQTVPRNIKSFETLHSTFFGSNQLLHFNYSIIDKWIIDNRISSFCVSVCGTDIPRVLRTGRVEERDPRAWNANPSLLTEYYNWLGVCCFYKAGRNKNCYLVATHLDMADNCTKLKEWCDANDLIMERAPEPWVNIERGEGRPSVTYIITANKGM